MGDAALAHDGEGQAIAHAAAAGAREQVGEHLGAGEAQGLGVERGERRRIGPVDRRGIGRVRERLAAPAREPPQRRETEARIERFALRRGIEHRDAALRAHALEAVREHRAAQALPARGGGHEDHADPGGAGLVAWCVGCALQRQHSAARDDRSFSVAYRMHAAEPLEQPPVRRELVPAAGRDQRVQLRQLARRERVQRFDEGGGGHGVFLQYLPSRDSNLVGLPYWRCSRAIQSATQPTSCDNGTRG